MDDYEPASDSEKKFFKRKQRKRQVDRKETYRRRRAKKMHSEFRFKKEQK